MTDVIEVMVDKHVHKDGEEVTREVTKEFRDMVGGNICGRCVQLPARPPSGNPRA